MLQGRHQAKKYKRMVVKTFIILTGANESSSVHVLLVAVLYHQLNPTHMDIIYIYIYIYN